MFRKDIQSAPLITHLEVNEKPVHKVAYSIEQKDIKSGDILKLKFQIEAVNKDAAIPVKVGCFISDSDNNDFESGRLTPISVMTVQPGAHQIVHASCNDLFEENAAKKNYKFIVYAYAKNPVSEMRVKVKGAGHGEATINVVRHVMEQRMEEMQNQVDDLAKTIEEINFRLQQLEMQINQVEAMEQLEQAEIGSLMYQEEAQGKHIKEVEHELERFEKTSLVEAQPSSGGIFRRSQ